MFLSRYLMIPALVRAFTLGPMGAAPAKGAAIHSFFYSSMRLMFMVLMDQKFHRHIYLRC